MQKLYNCVVWYRAQPERFGVPPDITGDSVGSTCIEFWGLKAYLVEIPVYYRVLY